jgi:Replication protein
VRRAVGFRSSALRGFKRAQETFDAGELLPRSRRTLKLRAQLSGVLDAVLSERSDYRVVMLGLTERNSSSDEFGDAIERLQAGFKRLCQRRPWKRTVVQLQTGRRQNESERKKKRSDQ